LCAGTSSCTPCTRLTVMSRWAGNKRLESLGYDQRLLRFRCAMAKWKKNIIYAFMITMWCTIGLATVVLSVAAMKNKNHQLCTGYEIEISGGEDELFIDKEKIEEILFRNRMDAHRRIAEYDLRSMEKKLEANVWIRDAQLFFDNSGKLQVTVQEREPIARVFTTEGKTFFIDSSGARLPVERNKVARLPLFTNFPAGVGKTKSADSVLISEMIRISKFINSNTFWSAQLEQLDITSSRTFELVPLVGNHTIVFGDDSNMEEKFERLFIFYKQVMSKTGFEYYAKLDVQYAGQVVATRKAAPVSKQDSLLAVQKVQQMIAAARELEPDTLSLRNIQPVERSDMNEQSLKNYDLLPMNADSALPETPKTPGPVKTIFEKQTNQHISKPIKKVTVKKEPKATMQKRGF
jgi:cell division protein FtsQ